MVSIDSWEYPTNFLVLQPKTKLNGYSLILRRPWLTTANVDISFRAGNITVKNVHLSKQLMLYPPAQDSIEDEFPLWLEDEDEE